MMTWAHARVDIERAERQLVLSLRNGGKGFDDSKNPKNASDKEDSGDEELSD